MLPMTMPSFGLPMVELFLVTSGALPYLSNCQRPARRHVFETQAPKGYRGMPVRERGLGPRRRQMDGPDRLAARQRPQTLQRAAALGPRDLAQDAGDNLTQHGARRVLYADGVPDDSAARRIRTDKARARASRAGSGARELGHRKPRAAQCRAPPVR